MALMSRVKLKKLKDQTIVITGASSGIGLATARHLAGLGAHVTIADIDGDAAEAAAAEVGGAAWTVDLGDTDALADVDLDADILVNNAGIQRVSALQDFDPAAFRAIHRIMVEAPFLLIRATLPGMYERGWGRVVNISSVHGLRASAFKSAYVSAKHGLEGLSKVIALEAAGRGVTSNTVCPGYVRTPLVEGQIADQARTHGVDESEVLDDVLLDRLAHRHGAAAGVPGEHLPQPVHAVEAARPLGLVDPVAEQHHRVAGEQLEADLLVGVVVPDHAGEASGDRGLLDLPVCAYDERSGVARDRDLDEDGAVVARGDQCAHDGDELVGGVVVEHVVERAEDPAGGAVVARGGADALAGAAVEHRRVHALAADIA